MKYCNKCKNEKEIEDFSKNSRNPLYNLIVSIRCSISNNFRCGGFTKSKRTENILGCTFFEFKIYIESKFELWMNWDNKGLYNGEFNYGWDIDHITPSSSAKTLEDVIKLNHYTNLQPLCSKINRDIKRGSNVLTVNKTSNISKISLK